MATVKQVIEEVYDEVQDYSLSVDRILRSMNRGAQLLALGHFEDLGIGELFLPALEVFTSVTLDSDGEFDMSTALEDSVAAPYCKELFGASVTTGGHIDVVNSLSQIERYYPGLQHTGGPQMCCISKGTLIAIPRDDVSLYVQYFKKAPTLLVSSDLDWLPDEFAVPLLTNFVLQDIPSKYKKNLEFEPRERFTTDITRMFSAFPVYSRKPKFVHNQVWEDDYGNVSS